MGIFDDCKFEKEGLGPSGGLDAGAIGGVIIIFRFMCSLADQETSERILKLLLIDLNENLLPHSGRPQEAPYKGDDQAVWFMFTPLSCAEHRKSGRK